MASRGLRVLAFAYRDGARIRRRAVHRRRISKTISFYLGLVALSDPLRPEVAAGDPRLPHRWYPGHHGHRRLRADRRQHRPADRLGAGRAAANFHRRGNSPRWTTSVCAPFLIKGETIFARVAPEHKLRIVAQLKQMGEIVAVTGDGVNDAPALKKADIGIAMGLRGNDVAKEASRMILTDDNFSSIVAAIEEGRAIFDNIKRFAAYVLNSNPQEMYPYIFWVLFPDIPLAMTVMGVLAVDVGTDLIPAMGLGIEPPEEGIMERPPRRRDEKILSLPFHPARLLRPRQLAGAQLLRDLLLHGLGPRRLARRPKLGRHAGVAARSAIGARDAGLPANFDRLLFSDCDHADRQCLVQALGESFAIRAELSPTRLPPRGPGSDRPLAAAPCTGAFR